MAINQNRSEIRDDLRLAVIEAIGQAQTEIQWKSGKGSSHFAKRIHLEHLPFKATLTEYELIISAILNDDEAKVYLFLYDNTP